MRSRKGKMTLPIRRPDFEFVGWCKCGCGAIVYLSADMGQKDKSQAREIGQMIMEGCKVERLPWLQVKEILNAPGFTMGCKAGKQEQPQEQQIRLIDLDAVDR